MRFQQRHEVLLKRRLPVMFFLVGNVRLHPGFLRRADGECPIAILPAEIVKTRKSAADQPEEFALMLRITSDKALSCRKRARM